MCSKFMPQMPAKAVATAKMPAQAASRLVISVSSIVTIERLTWMAVRDRVAQRVERGVHARQVVVDVAEVLAVVAADLRHAAADELGHRLLQRRHGVLEDADPAASARRAARCWRGRGAGSKICSSIDLELGLEGIDDREVAVDHRVHQRIEARTPEPCLSRCGSRSARARTPRKPCWLRLRTESTKFGPTKMSTSPMHEVVGRARSPPCAARRTGCRRTPRSSAAGGRGGHPRSPGRAGRTPPASSQLFGRGVLAARPRRSSRAGRCSR